MFLIPKPSSGHTGGPGRSAATPCERVDFQASDFLSLGVEVEVQLVDKKTLNLQPAAGELLQDLEGDPAFRPELFMTMLEYCSGVCRTVSQAEQDLRRATQRLVPLADAAGLHLVGIGAHPFAGDARDTDIWANDRYRKLIQRAQWIALRANIFGLHVHVGARNGDHAIQLINGVTPFLPHLLALSASSPYYLGKDTGLATARATVFESKPTAGPAPQFRTWSDFEVTIDRMKRSGSIHSVKDLHWDIRPSPSFGTVEVRICDGQNNLANTLALVAATQCLFAWIDGRIQNGEVFEPADPWLFRENKWRVIRYGLDTAVVINNRGDVRPLRQEWFSLLEEFAPFARELGCRCYLNQVADILEGGPHAARQREFMRHTGSSLRGLMQALAEEFRQDGVIDGVLDLAS